MGGDFGQIGIGGIFDFTVGLVGACFRGLRQALLHGGNLAVAQSVAAHQASIEKADGGNGVQAFVTLRGGKGVAASAANAKRADAVFVHALSGFQKINHRMHVIGAIGGFVGLTRLAAAGALIRGIGRNGDIAFFGQTLRIKAGHLLFHAAIGMGDGNGGIAFCRVEIRRRVNVGRYSNTIALMMNGVNVKLAGFIFRDGALINQVEWVVLVLHGSFLLNGMGMGDFGGMRLRHGHGKPCGHDESAA